MDENNKRKRTLDMVMSNFTDDLWIEIFLRLSIKSLLRFKSVSKSWFSIISRHQFAKSHLETAPQDDEILIVQHGSGDWKGDYDSFSLLLFDSWRILKYLKFPYSQGEYPFKPLISNLIGTDCGIVCVSLFLSNWPAAKKKYDIYLWNPATKHSKLIPPYTISDDYWQTRSTLGFGFDHIDLDFKLVRVVTPLLSAEVYSSNNNNWRKIQSTRIDYPYVTNFHLLHGFLFAIGLYSLMAFNLNKEVFVYDINLPVSSFPDAESDIKTCITEFKDTISVIFSILNKGIINLWTLDDEACVYNGGVEASWTKVLNIDVGVPLDFVRGLLKNVQFLLHEKEGDYFLYNWKKKVTTKVPTHRYLKCEFFKYTKSLFSLVGFKRIKWAASSPRLQDSSD